VGLVALVAIARLVLSSKPFTAGDGMSSAVVALRTSLDAIVAAGLLLVLLTIFVIRMYDISSISMIPTLRIGDVFLVNSLDYRLRRPRNGEIAVFVPPVPAQGDEFIKRVIGVPGDALRISDGIVYRNGKPLAEPYENEPPNYDLAIRGYSIYVNGVALDPAQANIPPRSMWHAPDRIPDGFYFMLGDNRDYSSDSHVWGFAQMRGRFVAGPLARTNTHASFGGPAFLILWPLSHLGILHT
jgi:signal peptidase I